MKYEICENDIKTLRVAEELSQRAFAEKYNIPVRTLQEWEQGRSAPPAYVLSLINNACKQGSKEYPSIDDLFNGVSSEFSVAEMPSGDLVGKELL